MAGANVIEAAIGITLLIIVSYIVIGSIMTSGEVVSNSQKDITLSQSERLATNINVSYADTYEFDSTSFNHYHVRFRIRNTGNERIDFTKMGVVIIMTTPDLPNYYRYGSGINYEWNLENLRIDQSCSTPEVVNPGQWDPNEYLCGNVDRVPTSCGSWVCPPVVFYAFTGNGVSASRYVT
jgi:hypothetical protein